jgi:DNA-binding MarR family transcriptional regulator
MACRRRSLMCWRRSKAARGSLSKTSLGGFWSRRNVCGLIDRMEVAGWVERRADPDDRRANRLYLTQQGRERLVVTMPDHHALIHEILEPFDEDQLQAFHDLHARLEANDPQV